MDVSSPAAPTVPAADLPGATAAAPAPAGPEHSFAAVLAEGPILEPSASGNQRRPISTPILEDPPVAALAAVRSERSLPARASLEVTGERASRAPASGGHAQPSPGPLSWQRLADNALAAEGRIDSMIEAGRRGKAFTAGELIGLQMEVFRYSQTVEVISRTTDKIVGAFKQVLGTQV
jgi:hypothetical protein